jgi:hypothetical protein
MFGAPSSSSFWSSLSRRFERDIDIGELRQLEYAT